MKTIYHKLLAYLASFLVLYFISLFYLIYCPLLSFSWDVFSFYSYYFLLSEIRNKDYWRVFSVQFSPWVQSFSFM